MAQPESTHTAPTGDKLAVINGLRGIAVLGVIYHHIGEPFTPAGWQTWQIAGLQLFPGTILTNGWMGVKLFFLLSGFVLFLPYCQGKRQLETKSEIWEFYRRRADRLVPLYALVVLVGLSHTLMPEGPGRVVMWIVMMGTLLFPLHPRTFIPQPNWVLWSLGTEIYYSIIFPAIVKVINRFGMAKLLVGSFAISLAVRFAALKFGFADVKSPYMDFLSVSLPACLDDFAAGNLLCWLYVKQIRPRQAWMTPLMLGGGIVILFLAGQLCDAWQLGMLPSIWKPWLATILQVGFFLTSYGLLLQPAGWLARIVACWPLQMAGLMCFSLYVWHSVPINFVAGDRSPMALLAYTLLVIPLSWITYRYIEFGKERDWRKLLPK